MTDRTTLMRVARAIHLARVKEGSFAGHPGPSGYDARLAREPWPEDRKEAERLFQAGQSWMDLAMAQAKAAIQVLEGQPYMGQTVAECDCGQEVSCHAAGRCLALHPTED